MQLGPLTKPTLACCHPICPCQTFGDCLASLPALPVWLRTRWINIVDAPSTQRCMRGLHYEPWGLAMNSNTFPGKVSGAFMHPNTKKTSEQKRRKRFVSQVPTRLVNSTRPYSALFVSTYPPPFSRLHSPQKPSRSTRCPNRQ